MEHKFDSEIAVKHGLEFAIVFKVLNEWMKVNDKDFTIQDIILQCPYLKPEKIAPCLNKLVEVDILSKVTKKIFRFTEKAHILTKKR